METWTNQLLPLALKLPELNSGPAMKPTIDEMSKLGDALLNGVDTNGNGQIEAIEGECGAGKAYEFGWFMTDFLTYTCPNRMHLLLANKMTSCSNRMLFLYCKFMARASKTAGIQLKYLIDFRSQRPQDADHTDRYATNQNQEWQEVGSGCLPPTELIDAFHCHHFQSNDINNCN